MAAPILEIEVRWRPRAFGSEWRLQRFPPTATVITLTGLQRGVAYDCDARSLGPGGLSSAWVPVNFVVASQSSTPIDQIVLDLDIEQGVVIVDCTLSKFRLTLNANVASWRFENVPSSKAITIEIEQWSPGGHTIAWPASVVPVSGTPHVMTAAVGGVDVITLSTTDGGKTWRQTVGQPAPSVGGALGISLAPSPANGSVTTDGVTAAAATITVVPTVVNSSEPSTVVWTRADSGGTDFTRSGNAFTASSGTTAESVTQSWRATVTDANKKTASATVSITLARVLTGGLSVSISPSPALGGAEVGTVYVDVSAYASGGGGTRSYLWRRVDGNGGSDFGCDRPNGQATTFSMGGTLPVERTQRWRCEVTDSTGTAFADVEVSLVRYGDTSL